MEEMRVRN